MDEFDELKAMHINQGVKYISLSNNLLQIKSTNTESEYLKYILKGGKNEKANITLFIWN